MLGEDVDPEAPAAFAGLLPCVNIYTSGSAMPYLGCSVRAGRRCPACTFFGCPIYFV